MSLRRSKDCTRSIANREIADYHKILELREIEASIQLAGELMQNYKYRPDEIWESGLSRWFNLSLAKKIAYVITEEANRPVVVDSKPRQRRCPYCNKPYKARVAAKYNKAKRKPRQYKKRR